MRLDHIAYRVANRHKTAEFFIKCFGYRLAEGEGLKDGGFLIEFPDKSTAECLVLEPPEKCDKDLPWSIEYLISGNDKKNSITNYHLAPEIFVSDGSSDSIVGKWVANRGGIGGVHHMAFQVDSVAKTMEEWKEKGYAEFASEKELACPGLIQVFTKPSVLTGIIYEFIERETHGFCQHNVKDLMISTKDFK